jgi:hypothetical protein
MSADPIAARYPKTVMEPLGAARRRRAELRDAVDAFERALGVPTSDPAWRAGLARQLSRLKSAFAEHVAVTEGSGGLYACLLDDAPRLANEVDVLMREHAAVGTALDKLSARIDTDVDRLCGWAEDVLRAIAEHRQRGADLIYEAYTTDLGGEN